jgi:signal transduction histidine kinase
VLLTFADTGVGIDASVGDRLFDPLYTTKDGGLGLGLSICRKIIRAHGGQLWMEQNVKHGVTFTFTVPIRRPGRCRNDS